MHHVNPAPLTSSGSIDTMPLRHINTPGILRGASTPLVPARRCPSLGYIIFIKCIFSSSFYCLFLLTLVFRALLTPPGTCAVPSSPHALCQYLHPLLAMSTSPLPSSGFVDAGHCAHLSMPPCKFFFLFLFCFASLTLIPCPRVASPPHTASPPPPLASSGCVDADVPPMWQHVRICAE